MYHAPVRSDDLQLAEPASPLEAELGIVEANRGLRDAHLHASRTRANALFAPFFAATAAGATLLVAWAMLWHVPLFLIFGWVAAVGLAHSLAYRRSTAEPAPELPRRGPKVRPVLESAALAAIWASLPTWSFATEPPEVQVVIGGALGAMIVSALALGAVPAAAMAFVGTLTIAFCLAFFFGGESLDPKLALTFIGVAAVAVLAVGRISRWIDRQLKTMADIKTGAENVRLLLGEYERRGAGWLWQVDAENRILYVSPRIETLLGRSPGQLRGHSLPASVGGNAALGQALLARKAFAHLEIEMNTRQGMRWIALAGDPVIDPAGRYQGFRGVGSDVTDARRTQERLTNLANLDALTGLPNRGRVRQLLGEALSAARAGGGPCAIMFLDLDAFKPVNDTFGHPKGDQVLRSVARRLQKAVGPVGHVGRMGGDEFAIVLFDIKERREVEGLATRIVGVLAEPFTIDKAEIQIGVSIGCAFGPADGQSVDDLIQKADLALYQAKGQGGGTFRAFSAQMQNAAEDRQRTESDMLEGIKTGQFHLAYQPLVDAASQRLVGFEALLRWHHPTRGIVPPNEFIPLAEESGIILPLGEWVVREACRAASHWSSDISVAVNVSARQLASLSFPGTVRDALSRYKLAPNRIELEVTESVFLGDTNAALEVLRRLRALGLGIALDDFGTGYSSLGYLNKAVFHKLKIDGSFVREAGTNKEAIAIIQSIVALARSFRMSVTAEGVETHEDFCRMRDLGCQNIQGYLFGRPMSFEDASALVARGRERARA